MNIKEERGDIDPGSQSMIRVFVCEALVEEDSWSRSKSVNQDVGWEGAWVLRDHFVPQMSTVEGTGWGWAGRVVRSRDDR